MPVRNLRHYDEEFDYIELTKQTQETPIQDYAFAVRLPLFPAKSRRHGGADALRRAGANSAHFRCARAL